MEVSQYLNIFIDETQEHLQNLNSHLLVLEDEPGNKETINEIFRAAHSIKGMSATMGFVKMLALTHDMENVFQEIRNGNMTIESDLIDILFKGLDALELYLESIQESSTEGDFESQEIVDEMNLIFNKAMGLPAKEEVKSVEEVEENKEVSDQLMKFKGLTIADHEKSAIVKAGMIGLNVIGLTVYIQDTCLLKGARAFMINRSLEEYGDIIKLFPNAQDLEDENYERFYSAFIITNEKPEKIKEVVMGISEVKDAFTDYVKLPENEVIEYTRLLEKYEKSAVNQNVGQDLKQSKKQAANDRRGKAVASRSVRVDIEKLDELMNLVSELIIAKNSITSLSGEIEQARDIPDYLDQIEYLERLTSNLHESVMKVRMVPIETVVNRFPRMIRDLSKKLNKDIDLIMTGEDTELDRTVIDEIGDPLMHLLRNAADHGLETTRERINKNKEAKGNIYFDAFQEGNNVVIEVRDDGGGIDLEKIKKKALEKESITQEEFNKMSDKEAIEILFRPSFSTSENITDVSGRGVGLDVVKTKIESLGGNLEATTKLGQGSVFTIRLPLTLAIVQVLMITLNEEKYAIPLASIQTVEDIPFESIKKVDGNDVINLRGSVIPVMDLGEMLGTEKNKEESESLMVVIIKKGDNRAGLIIDDLIGQQEIVIKSIGQYIKSHKTISGSTILGNGEVALILDVNSLV